MSDRIGENYNRYVKTNYSEYNTKQFDKNNFKNAEKLNSIYAVIIGDDEIKNGKVKVKNLATKEEDEVTLKEFEDDILQGGHHE